jgi:hypothetical protein
VKNIQKYNFDRGHSVWRRLLLPHGDLQLSVLTRLSLSGDHKVRRLTPTTVVGVSLKRGLFQLTDPWQCSSCVCALSICWQQVPCTLVPMQGTLVDQDAVAR